MKTTSLQTHIYKSLIVGLVPVLAIVNLQSVGMAAPAKASKSTAPVKDLTAKISVAAPSKTAKTKAPAKAPAKPKAAPATFSNNNNFADSYTLGPGDRLRRCSGGR